MINRTLPSMLPSIRLTQIRNYTYIPPLEKSTYWLDNESESCENIQDSGACKIKVGTHNEREGTHEISHSSSIEDWIGETDDISGRIGNGEQDWLAKYFGEGAVRGGHNVHQVSGY